MDIIFMVVPLKMPVPALLVRLSANFYGGPISLAGAGKDFAKGEYGVISKSQIPSWASRLLALQIELNIAGRRIPSTVF